MIYQPADAATTNRRRRQTGNRRWRRRGISFGNSNWLIGRRRTTRYETTPSGEGVLSMWLLLLMMMLWWFVEKRSITGYGRSESSQYTRRHDLWRLCACQCKKNGRFDRLYFSVQSPSAFYPVTLSFSFFCRGPPSNTRSWWKPNGAVNIHSIFFVFAN